MRSGDTKNLLITLGLVSKYIRGGFWLYFLSLSCNVYKSVFSCKKDCYAFVFMQHFLNDFIPNIYSSTSSSSIANGGFSSLLSPSLRPSFFLKILLTPYSRFISYIHNFFKFCVKHTYSVFSFRFISEPNTNMLKNKTKYMQH